MRRFYYVGKKTFTFSALDRYYSIVKYFLYLFIARVSLSALFFFCYLRNNQLLFANTIITIIICFTYFHLELGLPKSSSCIVKTNSALFSLKIVYYRNNFFFNKSNSMMTLIKYFACRLKLFI